MPAMLDDPTSPPIKRMDATTPTTFPPKCVTLKDGQVATIIPFISLAQIPPSLVAYLCKTLAAEIEDGNTYPMLDPIPPEAFGPYWFGVFGTVTLLGEWESAEQVTGTKDADWEKVCLGSFYIKPNYPGRSSHVCNAGFLVTVPARNRGVGKVMGKTYLEWAPKLGYTYSVFNLVYETNVPSLRIWDSLGFERIGRVKKCGKLKGSPDKKIDAIVYGYDFEPDV
ncbi:histone acetyltransferase-like protein [Amniculicola lignicola CBS 123094]|uniref:Histone acetyltransferase-like protein n=1 Tax=Amniculicola lignicola CBS 123094 TaxID=1392246 RepID=A0A6A5WMN5_9PLEO|nr:histone acetyltransferase-like protein [Amniculicola lignicola CBS 123094]